MATTSTTSRDPIHTYNAAGTYTVTLTASHALCLEHRRRRSSTLTRPPPRSMRSSSRTRRQGPPRSPSSSRTPRLACQRRGNWNFGDGNDLDRAESRSISSTSGTYSVTLTATHATGQYPVAAGQHHGLQTDHRADVRLQQRRERPARRLVHGHLDGGPGPLALGVRGRDSNSTDLNPVHPYTAGGIYIANLTVWNSLRPDLTYTTSAPVVAYAATNAAFTTNVTSGSPRSRSSSRTPRPATRSGGPGTSTVTGSPTRQSGTRYTCSRRAGITSSRSAWGTRRRGLHAGDPGDHESPRSGMPPSGQRHRGLSPARGPVHGRIDR